MWLKERKVRQVEITLQICFAKKYEIIKNMAHAGHLKLMLAYQLQGMLLKIKGFP